MKEQYLQRDIYKLIVCFKMIGMLYFIYNVDVIINIKSEKEY